MHYKDQPVVWIHPVTGEYRIPGRNDIEMPLHYKMRGFEEKRFESYFEHKQWMKSKGLVNHAAEGIDVTSDALGKNRWGY